MSIRMINKVRYFFKTMAQKEVWTKILTGEKILSDTEAKELKKVMITLRKEYGFRT